MSWQQWADNLCSNAITEENHKVIFTDGSVFDDGSAGAACIQA